MRVPSDLPSPHTHPNADTRTPPTPSFQNNNNDKDRERYLLFLVVQGKRLGEAKFYRLHGRPKTILRAPRRSIKVSPTRPRAAHPPAPPPPAHRRSQWGPALSPAPHQGLKAPAGAHEYEAGLCICSPPGPAAPPIGGPLPNQEGGGAGAGDGAGGPAGPAGAQRAEPRGARARWGLRSPPLYLFLSLLPSFLPFFFIFFSLHPWEATKEAELT